MVLLCVRLHVILNMLYVSMLQRKLIHAYYTCRKGIYESRLEHDHEQKFPDHITTFHHIWTRYDNPLHSSSP